LSTTENKNKRPGWFGTLPLPYKWLITAIASIGVVLTIVVVTNVFTEYPAVKGNEWFLGLAGSNVLILVKMWVGHFQWIRLQRGGADAGAEKGNKGNVG